MTTIYYADEDGNSLGGFADDALPPPGAIVTPAPSDGRQQWDGSAWQNTPAMDTAIAEAAQLAAMTADVRLWMRTLIKVMAVSADVHGAEFDAQTLADIAFFENLL